MTESVHCAICGSWVAFDTDHVKVEAEQIRTESPNEQEYFVLHDSCWRQLSDGWMETA